MKGNEQVIAILNEQLAAEYLAIIQYTIHAQMQENWGLSGLAKITMGEAIEEMKHAERLQERIIFLEGIPSTLPVPTPRLGNLLQEQFTFDLEAERSAITRLNAGIEVARNAGDNVSRELMESILKDEDKHFNYLETQLFQISQIGPQAYFQEHIR